VTTVACNGGDVTATHGMTKKANGASICVAEWRAMTTPRLAELNRMQDILPTSKTLSPCEAFHSNDNESVTRNGIEQRLVHMRGRISAMSKGDQRKGLPL